ncbi:patatin-like phospholipase family protein [Bradyrhizobium iriomotense]|uniref:patatin-like phospholipase family protein n=1 Tax=Bradyrhizobium iriomotense TaxID=441950 RepID=UPI001B89E617|nr:patatin-like phospholipase family protein [Bradyrhizobium iriomotense]MBR1133082.1 patatin-like phospholipase family protein [Bradyrhizobium iriomotense]
MTVPEFDGDTAIGLAFSGGGTRAAAFAFGVLRGLDQLHSPGGVSYLNRIMFVTGVSGGSVTAAYFGLKGREALVDFRERFLLRDAEEALRTEIDLANFSSGLHGGTNGASRLTGWLDRNLFEGATMGELQKPGKPIIWINASDLFHRTPFVFSPVTFSALCSDLKEFPLSMAVAASAAVPVVFTPIVLESFASSCPVTPPSWLDAALADPNRGSQARAFATALANYRDPDKVKYLKLADGGITDNFGLSGLVIARAAAAAPYLPLTPEKAVRLRRIVFIVVNSGQTPSGGWSRTLEGPTGVELLGAVTDTAISSAVRSGFDAFRLTLQEWERSVRRWRCSLPQRETRRLGAAAGWRCDDITFEVAEVSFDQLGPHLAARLSAIPTRFKLPAEDVDLLIKSGSDAILAQPNMR